MISARSFLLLFVRFGMTAYLICLIVDGALLQAQMAVTGGRIPIPSNSVPLCGVALLLAAIFAGKLRITGAALATLYMAGFAVVDGLVLIETTRYGLGEIRQSFTFSVLIITLAGVSSFIPLELKQSHILAGLLIALPICLAFSAAQFFSNSPILPLYSIDGNFEVPSHMLDANVRAFSLFRSALHAGVFYALTAGLGTTIMLTGGLKRTAAGISILLASVFGCYATLTRLTMIGLVACVAGVFTLRFLRRGAALLPVIWLLLGALLVSFAYWSSSFSFGSGLTGNASLESRITDWRYYVSVLSSFTTKQLLFGTAVSPWSPIGMTTPATSAPIPIDNAYLGLVLNCGVIGLLLTAYFFSRAWAILYRRTSGNSILLIAGAAAFSTVPLFGEINDLPPQFFFLFMLIALSAESAAQPPSSEPRLIQADTAT